MRWENYEWNNWYLYLPSRGVSRSWSDKWDGRNNESHWPPAGQFSNTNKTKYQPAGLSMHERTGEREREMCVSLSSLPGCFVPLFGQTELWITVRKVKQKLSMRGGKGREATGCSGQLWSVRSSPHHHWPSTAFPWLDPPLFRQLSVGEGLSLWPVIVCCVLVLSTQWGPWWVVIFPRG